jgi:hypothetical protein
LLFELQILNREKVDNLGMFLEPLFMHEFQNCHGGVELGQGSKVEEMGGSKRGATPRCGAPRFYLLFPCLITPYCHGREVLLLYVFG